jgi:large subunit ribosomal protein L19
MDLIDGIEKELGKSENELPTLRAGCQVDVHYLIREGEKERVQIFSGMVIAVRGRGIRRSMIVRRIVQGEGVERTFPLHSPRVKDIVVTRRGDVRRAKLYYLRDRTGKSTRVKEFLGDKARNVRELEKVRRADLAAAQASAAAADTADSGEED